MRIKIFLASSVLLSLALLTGCAQIPGQPAASQDPVDSPSETTSEAKRQDKAGEYQIISPQEAQEWLGKADPPLLLDVRTLSENEDRRIPGDFLLPVEQLRDRLGEIPVTKADPILVYCRSGNRSATAVQILLDAGYLHVYDLGGINSWPYETESGER